MDEAAYRVVLENWHHRVIECDQIQGEAGERYGLNSQEYRRARAMAQGYRAAIRAAESDRRTT
jgi:hypothetical protein